MRAAGSVRESPPRERHRERDRRMSNRLVVVRLAENRFFLGQLDTRRRVNNDENLPQSVTYG